MYYSRPDLGGKSILVIHQSKRRQIVGLMQSLGLIFVHSHPQQKKTDFKIWIKNYWHKLLLRYALPLKNRGKLEIQCCLCFISKHLL